MSVLEAMESWAGPGNEARITPLYYYLASLLLSLATQNEKSSVQYIGTKGVNSIMFGFMCPA